MKTLNRDARRAAPRRRRQIRQHVGPAGLRHYARDVAHYDVPAVEADGLWTGSFVAGDLLDVSAGWRNAGPLEIAILDSRSQALVLSKCPGGVCRAGAKVPKSGTYRVRVRRLDGSRGAARGPADWDASADAWSHGTSEPFTLIRTRQLPRRLRARLAPRRRQVRPRYVRNAARRVFEDLIHRSVDRLRRGLRALRQRLPNPARHGTPATA